jgi:hypothetical protein
MYVISGLICMAGGVLGFFVLHEPAPEDAVQPVYPAEAGGE